MEGLSGSPAELWVVRHAESVGNSARTSALAAGEHTIALPARDPDIPLSGRGVEQARALGRWFGGTLADAPPTAVLISPYRRTRETAAHLAAGAGWPAFGALDTGAPIDGAADPPGGPAVPLIVDERLREKDAGRLEGLTRAGIIERYPAEAEAYDRIGKFYYRPPGGESWCDVILRLRSLVAMLRAEHDGGRVLIVAHQVIVVCLRYVLEGLDEASVLELERPGEVANASVTSYRREGDRLTLVRFNAVAPLRAEGAQVTAEPPTTAGGAVDRADAPAAPERPGATTDSRGGEEHEVGHEGHEGKDGASPPLITRELLAGWPLPMPDDDSDKAGRGQILVVGGDARVPGGALLAATAAMRVGAGKIQLAVAEAVAAAVGVAIPEARVDALPTTAAGAPDPERAATIEEDCRGAAAIVVGPGLMEPEAAGALARRVAGWAEEATVVIDAAALAGVTPELGRALGGRLVLTPNAGEMAQTLDWPPERVADEPERAALEAARRFGAVVALKGRETWIAAPDGRRYLNRAGNVGLAVSGSGDVLAGIVGGLLARGAEPLQAAAWASHLQGLAGEELARSVGPLGYRPSEVPALLPRLLAALAPRG